MVAKNKAESTVTVYDFKLTHTDIIAMMNDPQVDLANGVDSDQVLDLIIVRNGSEISMGRFDSGQDIVFRFKKKVSVDEETEFDIDVS